MRELARLLLCAIIGCYWLVGCVEYTPLFDKNVAMPTARHSPEDCHRSMLLVWRGLKQGDDLYGIRALLDAAWLRDPGNYEPYWGWGIFRFVQAEYTVPGRRTVKYLNDSIRYLGMARKMESLPKEERINLDMDIANSYNALGACYIQLGNCDLAYRALGEASNILVEIDPGTKIDRARYFELLAYNKFYMGDVTGAKAAVLRAISEGAQISHAFLKDVGIAEDEM